MRRIRHFRWVEHFLFQFQKTNPPDIRMSTSNTKSFLTRKGSKISPISTVSHGRTSEVPVKPSLPTRSRHSWLIITISLIAVVGVMSTIGVGVVSSVLLRSTTLSSK